MVAAISAINYYSDPEYLRLLQELMRFGIAPSGDKNVDRGKLEQAKTELIQKIQNQQQEDNSQGFQVQSSEGVKNTQDSERAQMEESRIGAMTVGELNRLYFGI